MSSNYTFSLKAAGIWCCTFHAHEPLLMLVFDSPHACAAVALLGASSLKYDSEKGESQAHGWVCCKRFVDACRLWRYLLIQAQTKLVSSVGERARNLGSFTKPKILKRSTARKFAVVEYLQ